MILSTRKLEYDAEASDEAVKSLMQAQHKAALRELKRGAFDDKIDQYLAGEPELQPRESEDRASLQTPTTGTPQAPSAAGKGVPARQRSGSDVSAAFQAMTEARRSSPATQRGPRRHPTPIPQAPPPVTSKSRAAPAAPATSDRDDRAVRIHAPAPRLSHGASPPRRDDTQRGLGVRPIAAPPPAKVEPAAGARTSTVLVSRPPIVVNNRPGAGDGAAGQPGRPAGPAKRRATPPPIPTDARSPRQTTAPRRPAAQHPAAGAAHRPPARTVREDTSDGIFEQNLISEKSLDEVILAYLSEDNTEEG